MKIILDFDDTILNTYKLTREFIKIFQKAGFTEKEFYANYQTTQEKTGGFDLETAFDLFSELKSFDKEEVKKEINRVLSKANNFVYSDFFDFADSFDKENLILISCGIASSQKTKIENSKIASFFNEIIIAQEDKVKSFKNISQKCKNEKIFFIEDKANQIDRVKKEFPEVIALKMERPQGRHINTKSELANYTVRDLHEARKIILNTPL